MHLRCGLRPRAIYPLLPAIWRLPRLCMPWHELVLFYLLRSNRFPPRAFLLIFAAKRTGLADSNLAPLMRRAIASKNDFEGGAPIFTAYRGCSILDDALDHVLEDAFVADVIAFFSYPVVIIPSCVVGSSRVTFYLRTLLLVHLNFALG